MGSALKTTCPDCNWRGEHKVERTEASSYYDKRLALLGLFAKDILYRKRHRRCSKCGFTFKTVEISEFNFETIVTAALAHAEASGADRSFLSELMANLSETVSRATTFRVLLLSMEVFGISAAGRAKEVADELDREARDAIIKKCSEELDSLGNEDRAVIVSHYGLHTFAGPGSDVRTSQGRDLERILRRLKHPSHSRTFASILSENDLL